MINILTSTLGKIKCSQYVDKYNCFNEDSQEIALKKDLTYVGLCYSAFSTTVGQCCN